MKIQGFQKTGLMLGAVFAMAMATANVFGQTTAATPMYSDIPATPSPNAQALPVTAPATPALSPAASQVLQLSQAKISDGTIITFVQNSGSMYGLDASQIVYLKQQGVSENVINAMLSQRTALASTAMPQTPPDNSAPAATLPPPVVTTDVAQPATPAPSVVVVPDTQTYYYDNWAYPYSYSYSYPYYGWPVYWGWGGWHGGFHDGFHGGFHGGFGGGGFHSGVSGGFHGSAGGGGFHGGGFHH
jgi:hypothetical protein